MYKFFCRLLVLLTVCLLGTVVGFARHTENAGRQPSAIMLPSHPTAVVRLAGDEVQSPVLRYRTMGKGRYKTLPMQAESDNIYSVTVPENGGNTTEYDVVFTQDGQEYHYPEAAPALWGTWVWLKKKQ